MIEIENLTKYYGPKPALLDATFRVEKGVILGLLGPNAAGKTTTMRILTGFLPPTAGTARVAGYDVTTHSLEVRRHIGYLPETVALYPELTVWDYLDFWGKVKGLRGRRRRERIEMVAETCYIADVMDTLIGKLSRGYRQRVGLAQALLHDPPVLIFDEPTEGLDPKQIIQTRQLIKRLGGDHTIILCSHILPEVSMTCQRVVIINEGRVVAEDTPENLTRRLRGTEVVEMEVRGPSAQVLAQLRQVESVLHAEERGAGDGSSRYIVECALGRDVRERLAATVVAHGWGLLELRPAGMSLEEIFLKLTTKEEELEEAP